MAEAFQFDVDNGGADPFGFARQAWGGMGGEGFALPMSPAAPAMFAIAAAGLIAAVSFTAGLAAGYALARAQPIDLRAAYR